MRNEWKERERKIEKKSFFEVCSIFICRTLFTRKRIVSGFNDRDLIVGSTINSLDFSFNLFPFSSPFPSLFQ